MSDPKRWLDDESAEPDLRRLIARAPRARPMDATRRALGRTRALKVAALPATAAAWFTLKSAAAFVAATTATAATVVVAEMVISEPAPKPPSVTSPTVPKRPSTSPAPVQRPSPEPEASASAIPAADPPAPPPPKPRAAFAPVPRAQGLAAESALLERARSALPTDPARSLSLVREYRATFSQPQLTQESTVIEIEALARLGRRTEARQRAERALSRGADGLYGERLQRLIEKIDGR